MHSRWTGMRGHRQMEGLGLFQGRHFRYSDGTSSTLVSSELPISKKVQAETPPSLGNTWAFPR